MEEFNTFTDGLEKIFNLIKTLQKENEELKKSNEEYVKKCKTLEMTISEYRARPNFEDYEFAKTHWKSCIDYK